MAESTQHKLSRVRPPRVQITYDVEIGDAVEKKELPFIVGIMADFSAMPEEPLPRLKERKFVEIDRDNLNDVLAASNTRLKLVVSNKIKDDNTKIAAELNFKHMNDFNPISVVNQVEPLRKLFEARQRLSDLTAKLDGNTDLDEQLQEVLKDKTKLEEIKKLAGEKSAKESSTGGKETKGAPEGGAKPKDAPKG